VTKVSAPDGLTGGSPYVVTYTYFNGLQNLQGRGFLGFGSIWTGDAQTGLTKITSYSQTFPTIGDVVGELTDYTVPNPWITLKNVSTTYASANTYSSSYHPQRTFPYVSQVVTTANDLFGNQMPTTTQTFTPDGYGNDTGATSNLVQNYSGINTVYATTDTYGYQNDTLGWSPTSGNWIIGRLTSQQIAASYTDNNNSANSVAAINRYTTYSVDQNTGFTTLETVQPGSGTGFTLATTLGYDPFGNKNSSSSTGDGQTRANTMSYVANPTADPGHAFPDTATNALGQGSSATYDLRWGLPLSATDIDGRVTSYAYDDLGRKTTENPPDGSKITTSYAFCQGVNGGTLTGCPTGAQYAIQMIDMGADGSYQMSPTKTAYYDTLDREIDADTQTFSGGLSRVARTYNTQLQLASVTRPYVPGATPATTTYAYDALNRVTKTSYPDGSWDTIQYPSTSKSITMGITSSYAGQNIWKTYDGRGNLTQSIQGVTESGKFTYIFSEYFYDGFNDLVRYVDPAGNTTKYYYDLLGRKDGLNDPDAGNRLQSYNAFDEMSAVGDGINLADMTYDKLGRMTLRCWTVNRGGLLD
jgi:YD repeat-containing protein